MPTVLMTAYSSDRLVQDGKEKLAMLDNWLAADDPLYGDHWWLVFNAPNAHQWLRATNDGRPQKRPRMSR